MMAETELFDFGAAAREAVQRAVDEIIPKLKEQLAKDINVPTTYNLLYEEGGENLR